MQNKMKKSDMLVVCDCLSTTIFIIVIINANDNPNNFRCCYLFCCCYYGHTPPGFFLLSVCSKRRLLGFAPSNIGILQIKFDQMYYFVDFFFLKYHFNHMFMCLSIYTRTYHAHFKNTVYSLVKKISSLKM